MKKAQRSRYEQNDEIAVTQNNEKLKILLNSLLHWPSKYQHIMSILTNHQNLINGGKNSKSENNTKKSPS